MTTTATTNENSNENSEAAREKISVAQRFAQRFKKLGTDLDRVAAQLGKYAAHCTEAKTAHEAAVEGVKWSTAAVTALEAAPGDLGGTERGRKGRGRTQLEPGTMVCIREDKREGYEDVLGAEDMKGLTVKQVGKRKVKCLTASGTLIFPPRGDLSIETAETATPDATATPAAE